MDKPIQVGDLVQVVKGRACGCPSIADGVIFVVDRINDGPGFYQGCGHGAPSSMRVISPCGVYRVDLWRVKRIPPLDELEGQRTEENLKVPA